MDESLIKEEINRIEQFLFNNSNWQDVKLTRKWAKSQPNDAGVYILFENEIPVYAGESGSISGRITDMLDSRHHTARRAIGEKRLSRVQGYEKATSTQKHPEHIEKLVHEQLSKFKLSVLPIKFGRKEFEEHIVEKFDPELNRKSKRKAGTA